MAAKKDAKPTKKGKVGGARPNSGPKQIVETPEEFEAKVEAYRLHCAEKGEPITQTGMAFFMGFASRQSFYDYSKRKGFERAVARARLLVEREYEWRLHDKNCVGAIFALKNQGWSDRQDHTLASPEGGPVEVKVTRNIVRPDAGG